MFRIGEFSKVAQVSGRLLRYYDELGLFKPVRSDPETGYRYYSAKQLPELNRILALKELGLTLDQIARLLAGHVSTDEIRGMLVLKKAQIEQTVREELTRIRYIESRMNYRHLLIISASRKVSVGEAEVIVQDAVCLPGVNCGAIGTIIPYAKPELSTPSLESRLYVNVPLPSMEHCQIPP